MSGGKRKKIAALVELSELRQWVAYSRNKVPISPQGAGSAASSMDPQSWGSLDAAKLMRARRALPGVGFVFSEGDPYVGIDLDHARDSSTGELEDWASKIVQALDSYTEVSPSGEGLHIFVRGELSSAARRDISDGGRVEVYDRGRYFTVTGQWLEGTPEDINEGGAALDRLHGWARGGQQNAGVPMPDAGVSYETSEPMLWLPDALSYVSPDDYSTWVRVGMALRNELSDAAFQVWNDWSAGSDKYEGSRRAWQKWLSFPDLGAGQIGLGTVVRLADEHGFELAPEFRGKLRIEVPEAFVGGWDEWLADQQLVGEPTPGLSIVFVDAAEAYADDSPFAPDIVGPGVLGAGDMLLLAGPPKSMKSFVMLDMVRTWCLGEEWHGLRPARALNAAIVQFELKADAMRRRVQMADLSADQVRRLKGKLVYTDRFSPVLNSDLMGALVDGIHSALDGPPDLVVFDPMANIFSGDNENDNAQMMDFIRTLRHVKNTISADAAMILVHHASKRSSDEREAEPFNAIRGSGSLRGAYDSGFYIERKGDDNVKMWCELRNGPALGPFELSMQSGSFVQTPEATALSVAQVVMEDAAVGLVWTRAQFCEHYAYDLASGSPQKLGKIVGQLLESEELCRWHPDAHTGLKLSGRSKGYLGVPGMLFGGEHPIDPIFD